MHAHAFAQSPPNSPAHPFLVLQERRNSILLDNLENLQLVINMDDGALEALGESCGILQPATANFRMAVTKNGRKRRNSSNSIFLTQTADNILDHKALVKCIAAAVHSCVGVSFGF